MIQGIQTECHLFFWISNLIPNVRFIDRGLGLPWGVLVLLKFEVNSQNLGLQAPQNFQFE